MTRQTALTGAELVAETAGQAVWLTHRLNDLLDDDSDAAHSLRDNLTGQITGMRWALCLLKGWNPHRGASRHGGQADQFVKNWHNLPGHCNRNGCGSW